MKVIYLKGQVAFLREAYRTIERDVNFMSFMIAPRVMLGTIMTLELQGIERVSCTMSFEGSSNPTLWTQLKDMDRDGILTWFYEQVNQVLPLMSEFYRLQSIPDKSECTQEEIDLYEKVYLMSVTMGLSDIVHFCNTIYQSDSYTRDLFSQMALGDL